MSLYAVTIPRFAVDPPKIPSLLLPQAASVEELYYSPSLRETIAYAKLIDGDMSPKKAAEIVFGNVYAQWGNIELQKVNDIITSMYES